MGVAATTARAVGRSADKGRDAVSQARGSTQGDRTHCHTAVAADDGYNDRRGLAEVADDLRNESRGTDDIEGGNTKDPDKNEEPLMTRRPYHVLLGVQDAVLPEHLGDDGDGRVDWVRDNKNERVGRG